MAIPFSNFEEQVSFLRDNDSRDTMVMKRAYHNLHHVLELCQLYDEQILPKIAENAEKFPKNPPPQDDIIFLVAFFHDVIYDAKKGDNEEQSDLVWKEFVQQHNQSMELAAKSEIESIVGEVSRIILATKSHLKWKPEEGTTSAQEILNTEIFLDMDLAILGASPQRYLEYATQIKIEYQHVKPQDFCKGRIAFLEGMLSKAKSRNEEEGHREITASPFFTDLMREMRHDQMIKNLTWEIEALKKELETYVAN